MQTVTAWDRLGEKPLAIRGASVGLRHVGVIKEQADYWDTLGFMVAAGVIKLPAGIVGARRTWDRRFVWRNYGRVGPAGRWQRSIADQDVAVLVVPKPVEGVPRESEPDRSPIENWGS